MKESPLKVLVCIVKENMVNLANQILNENKVCSMWETVGVGVGRNGVLDMFGLSDQKCHIIMSVVRTENVHKLLEILNEKLELDCENHGLVVSIPLGAISQNTLTGFFETEKQIEETNKTLNEEKSKNEKPEDTEAKEEENKDIKE